MQRNLLAAAAAAFGMACGVAQAGNALAEVTDIKLTVTDLDSADGIDAALTPLAAQAFYLVNGVRGQWYPDFATAPDLNLPMGALALDASGTGRLAGNLVSAAVEADVYSMGRVQAQTYGLFSLTPHSSLTFSGHLVTSADGWISYGLATACMDFNCEHVYNNSPAQDFSITFANLTDMNAFPFLSVSVEAFASGVPEPTSLAMLGLGAALLVGARRRDLSNRSDVD